MEYQQSPTPPTQHLATSVSRKKAKSSAANKNAKVSVLKCEFQKGIVYFQMRLIRKDELTVVSPRLQNASTPLSLQSTPTRFSLAQHFTKKRVISAVADSLGMCFHAPSFILFTYHRCANVGRTSICSVDGSNVRGRKDSLFPFSPSVLSLSREENRRWRKCERTSANTRQLWRCKFFRIETRKNFPF